MTTIAWSAKTNTLAADSRIVGGALMFDAEKTSVLEDGTVLACYGTYQDSMELVQWWNDGADPASWPPRQRCDPPVAGLVVITNKGKCMWFEGGPVPMRSEGSKFLAWGSGADFAMGAMAMGATPEQAVAIAARFNNETGGKICVRACGVNARRRKQPCSLRE